jgi:HlyD family secretion protein
VNVVLDFVNAGEIASALGDAYRVEVRVVLWESESVLKVPTSALFRQGSEWAVYVVVDGRAQVRTLTLGQRTGQEAEVREGLQDGELVVLHPTDALAEGVRVEVTSSP